MGHKRIPHESATKQKQIYICICFSAAPSICPTLSFPRCVHKSVLYVCVYCCPVNRFISTSFLDSIYMCSVQFSRSVVSDSLRPPESQHARPPCPSPTPGVHSDSLPSNRWCHPAISSSAVPFSSCPQSLPASGSFPVSQLFAWYGQSIRVSALPSVLPSIRVSIWYLLLSLWLTPLCITGCMFIHLTRTDSNAFFFMAEVISHCISISICVCIYTHTHTDTSQLLYPLSSQWTSRLLPCPGYCK